MSFPAALSAPPSVSFDWSVVLYSRLVTQVSIWIKAKGQRSLNSAKTSSPPVANFVPKMNGFSQPFSRIVFSCLSDAAERKGRSRRFSGTSRAARHPSSRGRATWSTRFSWRSTWYVMYYCIFICKRLCESHIAPSGREGEFTQPPKEKCRFFS